MEREIRDKIIREALKLEPDLMWLDCSEWSDKDILQLEKRVKKIKERLNIE